MMESAKGRAGAGAKATGAIYLAYFVFAFLGLFLMRGVVVSGNAEETARHLLSHADVVRAAVAAALVADVLYLVLVASLYRLFGSAGRTAALVAALVGAVGCTVQVFAEIFRLAPFVLLSNAQLSMVFTGPQLAELATASLALYTQSFSISLVLFGVYDIIIDI